MIKRLLGGRSGLFGQIGFRIVGMSCVCAVGTLTAFYFMYGKCAEDTSLAQNPSYQINLGRVWAGTVINHAFSFENSSGRDMNLGEARSSCSCTIAGHYTSTIKAGETVKIPIQISVGQSAGPSGYSVQIPTDTMGSITCQLSADVRIRAPRSVDVGVLDRGQPSTADYSLVSDGPSGPSSVVAIHVEHGLTATTQPGLNGSTLVHVSIPPRDRPAEFLEIVELVTSDPTQPIVRTEICGEVRKSVEVNPPVIVVESAETQSRTVNFKIIRCELGTVRTITASSPQLQLASAPVSLLRHDNVLDASLKLPPSSPLKESRVYPIELLLTSTSGQTCVGEVKVAILRSGSNRQ